MNGPGCGIGLLLRRGICLDKVCVPLLIQPRVGEQRFILRLLRDNLVVKGLIERRIDLGENVAFLYVLALGVRNIDEAAANLGANDCGVKRLNGADTVQIDGHVGGPNLRGHHWDNWISTPVAIPRRRLASRFPSRRRNFAPYPQAMKERAGLCI